MNSSAEVKARERRLLHVSANAVAVVRSLGADRDPVRAGPQPRRAGSRAQLPEVEVVAVGGLLPDARATSPPSRCSARVARAPRRRGHGAPRVPPRGRRPRRRGALDQRRCCAYAAESPADEFIVVTEAGLLHAPAEGRARQALLRARAADALPQHEAHDAREGARLPARRSSRAIDVPEDVRVRALARRRADGRDWLSADAVATTDIRAGAQLPERARPPLPARVRHRRAARSIACDVLVIGSGIAGLTAALDARRAARTRRRSSPRRASPRRTPGTRRAASPARWARPTRSSCTSPTRSWSAQGLCDEDVVRAVVGEARRGARATCSALGVRLRPARAGGEVALAREGGHSLPRVLHSGDATGADDPGHAHRRVVRARERRRASSRSASSSTCSPRATAASGALVLDPATRRARGLLGRRGRARDRRRRPALPRDDEPADRDRRRRGGGVARRRRASPTSSSCSSTPPRSTPTPHPEVPHHRGAARRGRLPARLRREALHARRAPARRARAARRRQPRDRAGHGALRARQRVARRAPPRRGATCARGSRRSGRRAPRRATTSSRDLIPVAPAAHYIVGGVRVDIDGRTSVPGLYASGEVRRARACTARTGSRSNSLLEGLVFSRRIVRALDATTAPERAGAASCSGRGRAVARSSRCRSRADDAAATS